MKVLLVNNFYTPNIVGGGEKSVQSLAEGLVAIGHDVVVVTASMTGYSVNKIINGVKVYYLPVLGGKYSPAKEYRSGFERVYWQISTEFNHKFLKKFDEILDVIKPDVLHSNNLTGLSRDIWLLAENRNIPCVHTLRDYFMICLRGSLYKKGNLCEKRCLSCRIGTISRKRSSKHVKAVVGNSTFILNKHLKAGFFDQAEVKKVIFSSTKSINAGLKNNNAIKNHSLVRFGFIGRFHETKGLNILFHAVNKLPLTGWELFMAGKGDDSFTNQITESRHVKLINWFGWIDPDEFFSKIDVLVVPSVWHDPLPRVIFEAYMYGVPVLVSDRGGCPEIVDEGKTGWVFDPGNPDTLFDRMKSIIDDPRCINEMEKACLNKAELFTLERNSLSYEKIYKSVVDASE
jgi:glycosyltransferase involved in cell wall biosynthesis